MHQTKPEHNKDTSTFFAQSVLHWYPSIVICDIGGASCRRVTRLYLLSFNSWASWNKDDSETIFSLASSGEVIRKTMEDSQLQ